MEPKITKAETLLRFIEFNALPQIEHVFIANSDGLAELLEGRKWITGRFASSLGIDQPTSGSGMTHSHVYGRTGKQTVVVNIDGSSSHGTKGKLHPKDADALRARGFAIPTSNIVEWKVVSSDLMLLLEDGRTF